jgi:hypothetical protein
MEDALRRALGIPRENPPKSPTTSKPRGAIRVRDATSKVRTEDAPTKSMPPQAKRAKRSKTPTTSGSRATAPKLRKCKKTKAPAPRPAKLVVRRSSEFSKETRQPAASRNAAARLAFNARQRGALSSTNQSASPFFDLKMRWQRAFSYIQRFQDSNPDAPDVASARHRLLAVEAEWERMGSLALDHRDYFPWPSTDAPDGAGGVAGGDWEEIGMLAYLGYHVGLTSELSSSQRHRLLAHVLVMRLPPLNSVAYMRSWGPPNTGPRLRKIAEAIAAFTRNAKRRRNPKLVEAIRQWEDDLSFLQKAFYVGRFDGFPWPAT